MADGGLPEAHDWSNPMAKRASKRDLEAKGPNLKVVGGTPTPKPMSISLVRSGPKSGLPTLSGKNAGWPPHPVLFAFSHVRTASNAPGARPDWPYAARTLIEPQPLFQNDSSESTQDALAFG